MEIIKNPDMGNVGDQGIASAPIGEKECQRFTNILQKYSAGKANTTARIQASEQWWKLRNSSEEEAKTEIGKDGGWTSSSGWLSNQWQRC